MRPRRRGDTRDQVVHVLLQDCRDEREVVGVQRHGLVRLPRLGRRPRVGWRQVQGGRQGVR
eukprot:6396791-Lingulodinium_polyedra.AAC.1